ncbi:alpha-amylase family glycosyl hydrolase [Haloferax sp. AB510]|uniref:alpha-amylase family glycosyl hydrolase n=1 Tax=Haloferax sp. AB510 TaxID=2934172 RepID=UPI00209BF3E2|nr:alpha-amylase family glycosyl hydrolase [Haloferax sp. AB510]MCO8265669.1 alpha-amylase family glycosyl hydrolase [Haloferax sp. AB510]
MHHLGPPRVTTVGRPVELAPRAPERDATYRWNVLDAPAESAATVGSGPVVHLSPDVPGTYRLELDAPDDHHEQTVRAFPDDRRPATMAVPAADLEPASPDEVSVIGPFNDRLVGRDRPRRVGDDYVLDVALPPGTHPFGFAPHDDLAEQVRGDVEVPGPGRPRVRLDGRTEVTDGDADGGENSDRTELVVVADAEPAPDAEEATIAVEFLFDGRDALEPGDCEVGDDHLRVPVETLRGFDSSEPVRFHAVAVQTTTGSSEPHVRHSVLDTLVVDPGIVGDESGSGLAISRPGDAPEWAHHATIYEVFVRSFVGETPDPTFDELARRVPYLESLGVDCLWLTPILESHTTHGYHVTDYFETASDLGSREDFEALVDRCHDAGIRVVFDLVINHTSRDHPAFQFHSTGVPGYEDHYARVPEREDPSDVDWGGPGAAEYYFNWTRIPNLNYDSPAVRSWMLDVVTEWATVVDGFRCDVAWGVPHGFWKEVRERVKADDPNFLLLDETIPRDPAYHETEFDAHYDTTLYGALRDVGAGEKPATAVLDAVADARWHGFPDDAVQLRYIENHDEERYRSAVGDDALRAAAAATFTLPGAPMIYYGQETGVADQRGTMRWHDADTDLVDFHRRLSRLRDAHKVLRVGNVEPVSASVAPTGDDGVESDRVVAFARDDGTDRLVVVLNFDGEPTTVELGAETAETDLLTGERVGASGAATGDGGVRVTVADAVVLRAVGDSSH